MNKIYKNKDDVIPLTPVALAFEVTDIGMRATAEDYPKRIEGAHCNCNGNGEFVLLPKDVLYVVTAKKRYMQCRICGGYSHL